MKFFVVIAATLATISLAAPADGTKAAVNDESAALKYLLTHSPAGHHAGEGGAAADGCYWEGTAPFCTGYCAEGYFMHDRDSCGDGACCWDGTYKILCCKE